MNIIGRKRIKRSHIILHTKELSIRISCNKNQTRQVKEQFISIYKELKIALINGAIIQNLALII